MTKPEQLVARFGKSNVCVIEKDKKNKLDMALLLSNHRQSLLWKIWMHMAARLDNPIICYKHKGNYLCVLKHELPGKETCATVCKYDEPMYFYNIDQVLDGLKEAL